MVGILLAAGFSRRFGNDDKLLYPLHNGQPIALASAQSLISALPISIAVVRPENKALARLLSNAGLEVIFCHMHDKEMADSLVTAIRSLAISEVLTEGFVIALADMPFINSHTIGLVAEKVKAGASIVIPTYHGRRGHPVGFSARFRQELENLKGDEGARSIIQRYPEEVFLMPCEDAGILLDIDTAADLSI